MVKKDRIIITDYNPQWAEQFEALRKVLIDHLGDTIIGIEHIGSTSIPEMKAKPIIDLDIIIVDNNDILDKVIHKLQELGYIPLGNLGITGREAFDRLDSTTPHIGTNKQWFKHNLYVCNKESIGLINHLNFRNFLRNNPKKVIEYSQLKQNLANKFPFDIDAYVDGKTNFIVDILNKTGMQNNITSLIEKQNKLKV